MHEFVQLLLGGGAPFLVNALVIGVLASVAFGIIGSFVVVKKISYLAGAISHAALAGIGASLFMNAANIRWLHPMGGALIAAVVAALIISYIHLRSSEREDTAIGMVWAMGMALGLLFIAKTDGYVDPMSYLFGNILLIGRTDIWMVVALDGVVVLVTAGLYRNLLAVCFDPLFAEIRGIRVRVYYVLLLVMTACTSVLLVTTIGIVMMIAMLTIPAAIGCLLFRKLWQVMLAAVLGCMLFNTVGLVLSYQMNLPSGPVIIVLAGLVYSAVLLLRNKR